jgi:hypothetical protein
MVSEQTAAGRPRRMVLEYVPYVGFNKHSDGTWELCPFPSSLKACLEYLGERHGYDFLLGATGAAFRLLWNSHEWDGGNVDLRVMYADPYEAFRRGFTATGYAFEIMEHVDDAGEATERAFRARIVQNIAEGRPIIGLGVIGPPEACVIAGYGEDGEVLVGWNFFQTVPAFNAGVEFESGGYFRKRAWFEDTRGLLLIGARQAELPLHDIYLATLRGAVEVVCTPAVHQRHNGLSAYQAWAADLLRDAQFSTDDIGDLSLSLMAHDDAATMVAEGRSVAASFLERVSETELAMAGRLLAAAELYRAENDLMNELWGLLGDMGDGEKRARLLARPEVRYRSAAIILQAREKDAHAIEHIKQALSKRE